ncbi:hypothetical protein RYX36_022695 [Vicia faba]
MELSQKPTSTTASSILTSFLFNKLSLHHANFISNLHYNINHHLASYYRNLINNTNVIPSSSSQCILTNSSSILRFMSIYRALSRASRSFTLLSALQKPQPLSTTFFHQFSFVPNQLANKLIPIQANFFGPSISSSLTQRFVFSSSALSESSKTSEEANATNQNEEDNGDDQAKKSDVEIEWDISRDELIKLLIEKEGF